MMGALEIIQIINALMPLALRAMEEGREVTAAEIQVALGSTDAKLKALADLIAQKP